jgi:hypothetical protein
MGRVTFFEGLPHLALNLVWDRYSITVIDLAPSGDDCCPSLEVRCVLDGHAAKLTDNFLLRSRTKRGNCH